MPTTSDLFVDTSGWASYLNRRDQHYRACDAIVRDAVTEGQRLVTTNYVIAELVALLSQTRFYLSRRQLIMVINGITARPEVEMVYIEQSIHNEAWALLEARLDKEWSLVDASSFVVMRRFGMTQALTTDHHFTQAGFIQVPGL